MYNVKSMQASEFIAHDEILETLAYASANKNNASLIDSIIAKAKERKGLSHREAAVLLDCELDEKNQEIRFRHSNTKKCRTFITHFSSKPYQHIAYVDITRYRHRYSRCQYFFICRIICISRYRCRYGIERNITEFCRRSHGTPFQAL